VRRDLKLERVYPYPPERVWRALTSPEALSEWLMPNDFEPRVGHNFNFRAKPGAGWDGVVNCEVLEVDEPRRLSYSWRNNFIDTVLTFTLEPTAEGTRLYLTQTGFNGVKALMVSLIMNGGWKSMLRKSLPAVLARMDKDAEAMKGGGRDKPAYN
jgi:uncharacterized protein YndB with AHSA1/START domain